MRKAIGIIYLISGILGIIGILSAIGIIAIGIGIASMYMPFTAYNAFDASIVVEAEVTYLIIYMVIIYAAAFLIGGAVSIASIIMGALALGKKMSDSGVAIGAIIFGAITGDIVILILGIVFMSQISGEKKKQTGLVAPQIAPTTV